MASDEQYIKKHCELESGKVIEILEVSNICLRNLSILCIFKRRLTAIAEF